MKELITEHAPTHIREQYIAYRDGSPALGLEPDPNFAIDYALDHDFAPEPPKTPATDRLNAAVVAGDFATVLAIRRARGWELLQEERALLRYKGLAAWIAGTSRSEELAEQRAAREQAKRDAEIEERARQIVADEAAALLARARDRARAELTRTAAVPAPAAPAAAATPARGRARKEASE